MVPNATKVIIVEWLQWRNLWETHKYVLREWPATKLPMHRDLKLGVTTSATRTQTLVSNTFSSKINQGSKGMANSQARARRMQGEPRTSLSVLVCKSKEILKNHRMGLVKGT